MSRDEILQFINSNPTCCLATSENDQPHVRVIGIYRADKNGIIFQTWKKKDLYRQIQANSDIEICFSNQEKDKQIRVKGKVVINKDEYLKKEIIEARPFLKPWIEKMRLDMLVVLTVVECQACVWTFEINFTQKEYIKITT